MRTKGRRGMTVVAAVTFVLSTVGAATASTRTPASARSEPVVELAPNAAAASSRVIIRWDRSVPVASFRTGSRLESIRAALGMPGAQFVRQTGSGAAIYDLSGELGSSSEEALSSLRSLPGVVAVEEDVLVADHVLPDDPRAADLWGLLGPDDGSPFGIDAPAAWPTTDGDGVIVAVVDSGLAAHEDLAGQSIAGYDIIGRDADATDPMSSCPGSSHGTLVAGTIAAIANNGIGVFGGAPGARVQPVRVSSCGFGFSTDVADGLRWAAGGTVPGLPVNSTPADVISVSSGAGDATSCLPEFASAIADAHARGAIVVVSAGNDDVHAGAQTPANCLDVLTVAAIDEDGTRSSFSNWGPVVDLAAPGNLIWTTSGSGGYSLTAGTSFAAPYTASAAALVRSAHASLSNDAVEVALTATTLPVAVDPGPTGCAALGCGTGIANPGRTLQRLTSGPPIVGRVEPSNGFPFPGAAFSVSALAVLPVGVTGAEIRVGAGPWQAMVADDGAFGGGEEWVERAVTAPSGQGAHDICVRAHDGLGAFSEEVCSPILVDAGPPTIAAPALSATTAASGSPVSFTASATDFNPLRSVEYRIDSGPWIPTRASDGAFDEATEGAGSVLNQRVEAVSVGANTCALLPDETIRCWGPDALGYPGDGTVTHRTVPVDIGLTGVQQVSSGRGHACALLNDGTVRCWGFNRAGALGDGTNRHRAVPVAVTGLTDVVSVSAGHFHTCALRGGGDVWCWGAAIGLGNGSLIDRYTAGVVPGLTDVVALSSGGTNAGSTCALLEDASVRCWGDNSDGAIGDGTTTHRRTPVVVPDLTDVVELTGELPCSRHGDGSVRCWTFNGYGQLGDGTTVSRLSPTLVTVVSGIQDIASGEQHKCAVMPGRTVRCWGYNRDGQLGDGTQNDSMPARTPIGLSDVEEVSAADEHTCAIDGDGRVFCWGLNEYGQLGDGSTAPRLSPVRVAGIGPLSGGSHQVCVRATDVAGRTSNGAACRTLTVPDTDPPTATIAAPASPVGNSFSYSIQFNESVSGLTASDFVAQGTPAGICAVDRLTGSGASYAVRVACTADGTFRLSLKANAVADASANSGPIAVTTSPSLTVNWTPPDPEPHPADGVTDIVGHRFENDIRWLYTTGITSGCSATRFCPDGLVTRGQMATFLARALDLPATSRDYFTDDEMSKHEANINRLRAAGITFGCTATQFCPNGVVTRGQMASFLVRAFDLPSTSRDYFTDDEGNRHEANINRLRASAVTFGCGPTTYCPNGSVTRGQMAAFLHRAS